MTMTIPPAPITPVGVTTVFHPVAITVAIIVLSRSTGKCQTADTEDHQ